MHLVERSVQGRAFLYQFHQILAEFGGEIPWLEPLKPLLHVTNPVRFRDGWLRALGCREPEDVTALQFVTPDTDRTYVGGIVRFRLVPERFHDSRNCEAMERLVSEGAEFISCLQVRDVHRGAGHGDALMRRVLRVLLERHGTVWGVVSDPRLLPWYRALGATMESPVFNQDDLWLVSWKCQENA